MDQPNISGKWKDIKGEIRNQWGKLTDDELERAKGNVESIAGLIQQRYGDAKDAAAKKLHSIFDRFSSEVGDLSRDVKKEVADRADKVKESLRDSTKH